MADNEVVRLALPPYLAATLETYMQEQDQLRQKLVDNERHVTGLIHEFCTAIGHHKAACTYSREDRELMLRYPTNGQTKAEIDAT